MMDTYLDLKFWFLSLFMQYWGWIVTIISQLMVEKT